MDDTPSSRLAARLASGDFAITSELTPPKGIDLGPLLDKARSLGAHVHAFNVTDSHNARMSLSALATAHLLLDQGFEPIMQQTTRDRNRIALQSDLLGAAALGIANVVLMGGDDPSAGDHPDAKPVFDMGTEALIETAGKLTRGTDASGARLHGTPRLFIGAVVNPGAKPLEREIARMAKKVEAGARFFQTQAIYDIGRFEGFLRRVEGLEVPLLAGIIPLKSPKMAQYLNRNVPGIEVPETLIARMAGAPNAEEESTAIAAETLSRLRERVQGAHIMAIGWERLIPRIVAEAGLPAA